DAGRDDEVRPGALDQLERLAAARRADHLEAVVAQVPLQVLAAVRLGLVEEERVAHARPLPAHASGEGISSPACATGTRARATPRRYAAGARGASCPFA